MPHATQSAVQDDLVARTRLSERLFELFRGRRSAYAHRVGKDYFPKRISKQDAPLSLAAIAGHLAGTEPIGVYFGEPGSDECHFGALDLDDHEGELDWATMREAAQAVTGALDRLELRHLCFRSGGGRGIHIFVLFSNPVKTAVLRRVLKRAIASVGYKDGAQGIAKKTIEVFPKRNKVDKYGNLIALPLARQSVLLTAGFDPVPGSPLERLASFTPNDASLLDSATIAKFISQDHDTKPKHTPTEAEPGAGVDARGLERCLFVQHCREHAANLDEPQWYGLACNLAPAPGGERLFHDISALDSERYDPDEAQKKFEHAREANAPHSCVKLTELGFPCPNMRSDGLCKVTGGRNPLSFLDSPKLKVARLRLIGGPIHLRNRDIANLTIDYLESNGQSYIANDDESQFYFYAPEKRLYRIGSPQFDALCCDLFGLNLSETEFKFVIAEIKVQVTRRAPRADLFRFARFAGGTLYVNAGGNRVFRLDGESIKVVDNGTDEVLFRDQEEVSPIEMPAPCAGSAVMKYLVNTINCEDLAFRDLYHAYIYSLFFESLLPTKPIVLVTGEKGSGKSFAGRVLKRALFGDHQDVDVGITRNERNATTAVVNNYFICMDNVDGVVPWLANLLASLSTGTTIKDSKLYENSVELKYRPHCFIMLNSRDPASLRRDDIADRLVIFEVERHEAFVAESTLLDQISANRGLIWRELLENLNRIVQAIKTRSQPAPSAHRLADFASLVTLIAESLDMPGAKVALTQLDAKRNDLLLENDAVVEALGEWVDTHSGSPWVATGQLFQQIAFSPHFPIKSPRVFGTYLKNMRRNLSSIFDIQIRDGRHNTKEVRITRLASATGTGGGTGLG